MGNTLRKVVSSGEMIIGGALELEAAVEIAINVFSNDFSHSQVFGVSDNEAKRLLVQIGMGYSVFTVGYIGHQSARLREVVDDKRKAVQEALISYFKYGEEVKA